MTAKGDANVMCRLMLGVLALSADPLSHCDDGRTETTETSHIRHAKQFNVDVIAKLES